MVPPYRMRSIFQSPLHRRKTLITSSKSACSWDWNELDHFGVYFKHVDFETFFRQSPPVLGGEWDVWLNARTADEADVVGNDQLWAIMEKLVDMHDLNRPEDAPMINESLTDLLAYELFKFFRYIIPGERYGRIRQKYNFSMFGDKCDAELDTVIVDAHRTHILLGFQEDKRATNPSGNLKAQIIPQSIALFCYNNIKRPRTYKRLTEVLIPVITMRGSSPTFYLIPITQQFVDDVAAGRSPVHETVVLVYEPLPEDDVLRFHHGLSSRENRVPVTQAYLAFKKFLLNGIGEPALPIDHTLHSLIDGDLVS